MNQLGLDLGSSVIKAVEVQREKSNTSLLKIAKADTTGINILSSSEADIKKAITFVTDFVMQNQLLGKYVTVSIPQALIFTKILSFPDLKGKDLEKAIEFEMVQESPIPLEDASKNYQILPSNAGKSDSTEVLVVIAPNMLTKKILNIVKSSGLQIQAIEPTSTANIRAIMDEERENPTTIIADIGEKNTDILIYSDFALRFTRSVSTGFESVVKAAAQDLNLEKVQAAEYVKSYGLLSDKLNGKIKDAVSPIMGVILNEIKRSITFYESRNSSNLVKRVVFCGGGSLIPGLVVYSANYLNTEVQIANPWNRLTSLGKYADRQKELEDIGPLFTTAVGLGLKPAS